MRTIDEIASYSTETIRCNNEDCPDRKKTEDPFYNGGLIFAKKYSRVFIGEYRNLAFCGGCAYAMMEYAKRKKVEGENAGSN